MTNITYVDANREYREAAEQLAALVLADKPWPIVASAEMVRLAEIVKAHPGTVTHTEGPVKVIIHNAGFGESLDGFTGTLQDTGADPVHPHFVPVKPDGGE